MEDANKLLMFESKRLDLKLCVSKRVMLFEFVDASNIEGLSPFVHVSNSRSNKLCQDGLLILYNVRPIFVSEYLDHETNVMTFYSTHN